MVIKSMLFKIRKLGLTPFNKVLAFTFEEHLKDPEIMDAVMERFSKYEVSLNSDIEKMKEYPDTLLLLLYTLLNHFLQ